jgi:glycine/D-amino acid oxidase-like deaminating enzyme
MPTKFAPKSTKSGSSPKSAIVIGGGIVGLAVACRLQKRCIATTLIDPALTQRGASWGNAGHIAIEQVDPLASPSTLRSFPKRLFWRGGALSLPLRDIGRWLPFALRLVAASRPARFAAGRLALKAMLSDAMGAWRRLLADAGAPDLLIEDGHYVTWETPSSAADGHERWAGADLGETAIRAVTPEEMRELQALTSLPIAGAIRFSGSGHIADTGDLTEALARHFVATGGVRLQASVSRIDLEQGHARVILDDGSMAEADAIVVAGGARSGTLMAPIGHHVPIIAERGYHIQSAETDWPVDMPPVVFEDRSMIVTRFRSGLRAASIVEFGGIDSPPDPRKWARLRKHVAALGLSFRLPGVEWIGARPTLPDYLPAIGRSGKADNLFYAFGHQHLGLTLAATTGEAMAALIAGETPPYDLTPFDLDRFGAVS